MIPSYSQLGPQHQLTHLKTKVVKVKIDVPVITRRPQSQNKVVMQADLEVLVFIKVNLTLKVNLKLKAISLLSELLEQLKERWIKISEMY